MMESAIIKYLYNIYRDEEMGYTRYERILMLGGEPYYCKLFLN